MGIKLYLTWLTFFIFNLNYAQNSYSRLGIGDYVPEVVFAEMKNYPGKSGKLSDFKGKYIILDFWDKTCGACIAGMPKMQYLQRKFADNLQIILVTKNTKKALSELFERSPILKNITLPFVLSDSILTKYLFPYRYLPRHIWLDSNLRVLAITEAGNATEENVRAMINGERLSFTVRNDIVDNKAMDEFYDVKKTLMSIDNNAHLNKLCYYISHINTTGAHINLATSGFLHDAGQARQSYSLFTKKIDGLLPFGSVELLNENSERMGVRFINYNLELLARIAYDFRGDKYTKTAGKVIFSPGLFNIPLNNADYLLWQDSLTFCYEAVIDEYTSEKVYRQLRSDFEVFFRIRGKIEERLLRCWVLYKTTDMDLLPYTQEKDAGLNNPVGKYLSEKSTDEGIVFSNAPFYYLVGMIDTQNNYFNDPIIILNQTGYTVQSIDLVLRIKDLRNIQTVNAELNKYGIAIKEEMRKSRVLVLDRISD